MDYENVFSFLKVPYAGVYAIALLFTIVALVISTRYSVKNLLRSKNGQDTEINSKRVRVERVKGETSAREAATSQHNESESEDEVEGDDDDESNEPALSPRYPDPVDYCEHIQGEIKRVQQKVANKSIAETLTEDQLKEEREIQRQQLADIFRLMQEQQDRFGIGTMDDMQEQMKLYSV